MRDTHSRSFYPKVHVVHFVREQIEYDIRLSARAAKDLGQIDPRQRDRISQRLQVLRVQPYPPGRKKLRGELGDYWRIRAGDFRIIYAVRQTELFVLVLRIVNRKTAY